MDDVEVKFIITIPEFQSILMNSSFYYKSIDHEFADYLTIDRRLIGVVLVTILTDTLTATYLKLKYG